MSGTLASVPKAGSQRGKEKGRVSVVGIETGLSVCSQGDIGTPSATKLNTVCEHKHVNGKATHLREERGTLGPPLYLILNEAKSSD